MHFRNHNSFATKSVAERRKKAATASAVGKWRNAVGAAARRQKASACVRSPLPGLGRFFAWSPQLALSAAFGRTSGAGKSDKKVFDFGIGQRKRFGPLRFYERQFDVKVFSRSQFQLFTARFHFNFFRSTFELRPLCSYFSRRAGGRSSGVPSAKPPFD